MISTAIVTNISRYWTNIEYLSYGNQRLCTGNERNQWAAGY